MNPDQTADPDNQRVDTGKGNIPSLLYQTRRNNPFVLKGNPFVFRWSLMCGSRGGIGGPDPNGKSQVIWVSIEISIWTPPPPPPPPLENVGPPLDLGKV